MNVPIALTLVRIVLVPLVIVFLISSDRVHVLIAAVIFLAASLTDWLDGRIARRTNQVTRLGTMLDPVADKLLVAAALVSLVQVDMVPAWMALVIIGRELAVTGLRGVALSMGVVVPASRLGKWKTVTQYVALTLLILEKGVPAEFVPFHLVSGVALWIAMGATVFSGLDYFYSFFLRTGAEALVKDRERWP
ncbi:MAG TPA: CDP-diacylglycerol--glycerol-3-phosphate 3-phosphatidyltransferase [Pseudomonadales bacterium]|nr:CDP-diacylglycerol--glycerol-3-phosphate 3-phosphatidyltransferase [Pseudomonadales bacterium]